MSSGGLDPPSPFLVRHRATLIATARGGFAVDLACGRGRHAGLLAAWGLRVVGLDRNRVALRELVETPKDSRLHAVIGDAEDRRGLPLAGGCAALLVVARFLNRERCSAWGELLRPGGLLLYETFRDRQRELGVGPSRPDFLLEKDELPGLFPSFRVLDHEEGLRESPQREWVASLLARKPG